MITPSTCNFCPGLFVPIPTLPALVIRILSSDIVTLAVSSTLLHKKTIEPVSHAPVLQCPIAHLVAVVPVISCVAKPIKVAVLLPVLLYAPADILKGKHVAPVDPVVPWQISSLLLIFVVVPMPILPLVPLIVNLSVFVFV